MLQCILSIAFLLLILQTCLCYGAYLDPGDYTSLGTCSTTGDMTINLATCIATGGGGSCDSSGDNLGSVCVFTFDAFTLNNNLLFSNGGTSSKPGVILSIGDSTINIGSVVTWGTSDQTAGPGGNDGGDAGLDGDGTGGGTNVGGGGGFGADGGNSGDFPLSGAGGSAYGATLKTVGIDGGSGGAGAGGGLEAGGGAGGGLELGAYGTVTISGTITSNGGAGDSTSTIGRDAAGGGSGGGILIHGQSVILNTGSIFQTNGGDGGAATSFADGGGGGAGGRIYIEHHDTGSITDSSSTMECLGGTGGTGSGGSDGADGTVCAPFVGTGDSDVPIPEPSTYAIIFGIIAFLGTAFMRKRQIA